MCSIYSLWLVAEVCYNIRMIITTSSRLTESLEKEARAIADFLSLPYVERRKRSLDILKKEYGDVVLLTQEGLSVAYETGNRFLFHPDTAMLRIKAPRDPLLELLGNQPVTVLDTTMGLASDSIVMSFAGHQVLALESQPLIHLLVSRGLESFDTGNTALNRAMRQIETQCIESLEFLRTCKDNSIDVIYCDPMFSEAISESTNLLGIKPLANDKPISEEFVLQARRVARKKIILKAHFRDRQLEQLGFKRLIRPNQKFHYGVIQID